MAYSKSPFYYLHRIALAAHRPPYLAHKTARISCVLYLWYNPLCVTFRMQSIMTDISSLSSDGESQLCQLVRVGGRLQGHGRQAVAHLRKCLLSDSRVQEYAWLHAVKRD